MTQVQVNQTNEHLDMMIQLENENQLLRQPEQPLSNSHFPHQGTTIQLCHTAEVKIKKYSVWKTVTNLTCVSIRWQTKLHFKPYLQVNKTRKN